MALDITELLSARLGESAGTDNGLPDALSQLKDSIDKMRKTSKDREKRDRSDQDRRSQELNTAYSQFNQELKETARILKDLNKAENNALKAAERASKRGEADRRARDAMSKNASGVSGVYSDLNSRKQKAGLTLASAILPRGLMQTVQGFLDAKNQTKSDIARLNQAKYVQAVGNIDAKKDARIQAADDKIANAAAELENAKNAYAQTRVASATVAGRHLETQMTAARTLDASDTAKANYEKATKERDTVSRDAIAAVAKAESGDVDSSADEISKGSNKISQALDNIVGAIRGEAFGRQSGASGLILDDATKEALHQDKVAATKVSAAESVAAAEEKVTSARDAYASTLKDRDAATADYATAGTGIKHSLSPEQNGKATYDAAVAKYNATVESATNEKASAVAYAEKAKATVYDKAQSGEFVTGAQKKAIGATNMMTAAASPVATIIAASLQEFMKLFPVIRQAGDSIVQLTAALPAVVITLELKLATALMQVATTIKEVFSQSDVSKRYEADEKTRRELGLATGGEALALAQKRNMYAYKRDATSGLNDMASAGQVAVRSSLRQTPQTDYTLAMETPSAASGVSATAPSRATVSPAPPAPAPESSVGVVPVGPSNPSIDNWRY